VGRVERDWDATFIDAALDPVLWPKVLREMAEATGAARGQLIGIGGPREVPFNWVTDFEAAQLETFVEIRGGAPDVNYRIGADVDMLAMEAVFEDHYDRAKPRLLSDVYVDFARDMDIPHGCQTRLMDGANGFVGLATLRRESEGRTNPAQRALFMRIAQAAKVGVSLQMRLEGQQAQLMAGTLDSMRLCAFLFDISGGMCAMTQGAQALVSRGLVRLSGATLEAPGARQLIARTVAGVMDRTGPGHARLRLPGPVGADGFGGDHFVELFRLPPREWAMRNQPRVVMIWRTSARDTTDAAAHICAAFGLSRAEADIALALVEGATREEIGARRGVTRETLRGQFKAIYAKTGCRSETDLALMMARYLG